MSALTQIGIFLVEILFLSNYWGSVVSIEPEFVWNVINTTIAGYKSHCHKVVLYSSDNEHLVPENATGANVTLFNIHEDEYEKKGKVMEVKRAIDEIDLNNYHPCIVMISIVNTTSDTTIDYTNETNIQAYKLKYSQQLMELLQFKTPMKCRLLVLVRLADEEKDLYTCTKAATYPRRLVPVWEQILFDFFSTVKVIQGTSSDDERELKVGVETGRWIWLCQDIIERLENEEQCQHNRTAQCREDEAAGKFSNLKENRFCSSKHNFRPRQ